MYKKVSDILSHLGAIAFGAIVIFWPEAAIEFVLKPWVWQLIIGFAMVVMGAKLQDPAAEEGLGAFAQLRYWVGMITMLIGFVIFLNFNRYAEILADTGPWPLYVCGGLIMFGGALRLIRSLIAEDGPPVQSILVD